MPLISASGTGKFYAKSAKIIRFARQGCTNRPFFHIVVMEVRMMHFKLSNDPELVASLSPQRKKSQHQPVIEQVGTYDPLANEHNQRLVSFNFERVRHWLGNGAHMSTPVAELLGLSGLLPIHPRTYMTAWNRRKTIAEKAAEAEKNESKEAVANS